MSTTEFELSKNIIPTTTTYFYGDLDDKKINEKIIKPLSLNDEYIFPDKYDGISDRLINEINPFRSNDTTKPIDTRIRKKPDIESESPKQSFVVPLPLIDKVSEAKRIKKASDFRKEKLATLPGYREIGDTLVSAWKRARSLGKTALPFMTPQEKAVTFDDTQSSIERHRRLTPRLQEIFARSRLRRKLMLDIDKKCQEETERVSREILSGTSPAYDVVVVGSGPHGALVASEIRERSPEARILIIDKNERIGGQFRQYGDEPAFYMNSRVRRASRSLPPVPRTQGNINPLGEFSPLQLSDVVRRIYADNTQIGDITAVNAFLSADSLLVGTNAIEIIDDEYGNNKRVVVANQYGQFAIDAKFVVEATGVSQSSSINTDADLGIDHSTDSTYWKTDDIYRQFGEVKEEGENALEPFDDKKVALIGAGDSALTTLEAMLGVLPESSYGMYGPSRLSPAEVLWIGAPATTAKEIDQCLRGRYKNGIVQALPKTATDRGSVIKPINQKLQSFRKNADGKWEITCVDGKTHVVDVLIDCTNSKPQNDQGSNSRNNVYRVGPGSGKSLSYRTQQIVRDIGVGENTVALWAQAPETAKVAKEISEKIAKQYSKKPNLAEEKQEQLLFRSIGRLTIDKIFPDVNYSSFASDQLT